MGPLTVQSWSAYGQLTVREDPPPVYVLASFRDRAVLCTWSLLWTLLFKHSEEYLTSSRPGQNESTLQEDDGSQTVRQKYREKLATSDFLRLHRSMRWGWRELQNSNSTISWYVLCRVAISTCTLCIKFFAYTAFHFLWALYYIFEMWMRKKFYVNITDV
jgi:hypothetical protein